MNKPIEIVLERLIGGLADDYQTSERAVEARSSKYSGSKGMSVFRHGYFGYLAPAEIFNLALGDSTPVVNSLVRGSVTDIALTIPKTYKVTGGLSGTAPRVLLDESSVFTAQAAISAHGGHNFTTLPSPGTGFWGEDILIYKHNLSGTPTRSLFLSYNDNTDGDIARFDLSASAATIGSQDDDFMSTVPTGGAVLTKNVPHKMVEGADLILYCLNGQYVASYDGNTGSNGTWNTQALNLGAGWVGVSIRKFKTYIAVTCLKSTTSSVFNYEGENKIVIWDGFSRDPNFVYEITDSRVTSSFVANDNLFVWSSGKNNTTKLWIFTGTGFKLLPGGEQLSSVIGNPPLHECVDYFSGSLYWAAGPGSSAATTPLILCYGPLDSKEAGIHIPMKNSDGTNTAQAGFLKNVQQGVLRTSGLYNATYKVAENNGDYLVNSQITSRLFRVPWRSATAKFYLEFAQFGTGASLQISLVKGLNTLTNPGDANDLLAKTLTNAALGGVLFHSFEQRIDDLTDFYVMLRWNHSSATNTAAILKRLRIQLVPTDAY